MLKRLFLTLCLVLFVRPLGAVTWAHVNGKSSIATSPNTLTLTFTPAAGTLLVVGCWNNSVTVPAISDNSSGPADIWAVVMAATTFNGGTLTGKAWATIVTAGTRPTTVTCTGAGNASIAADDYSGNPSSVYLDGATITATGSSTNPAATFTTGASAGDLLWSFEANGSGGSESVAVPFTIRQSTGGNYCASADDGISSGVAANTAQTATYTLGTTGVWLAGIVGFLASAPAGHCSSCDLSLLNWPKLFRWLEIK